MKLCKRGHDLDAVGRAANGHCRVCRRECDANWRRNQYRSMTGWEHNQKLLRKRRYKALARIAKRKNEEA